MIFWLEKRRFISFVLTLLIAIEIFFFSTIYFGPGQGTTFNVSVIYHFVVFFLFSFFLFATIKGNKEMKFKHILTVLIISLVYAISDEVHQSFTPGRDVSLKDILTDLAGSVIAMSIYIYTSKKNKKELESTQNKMS